MQYRLSRLVFALMCAFALSLPVAVSAADPGEADPGVVPPAPTAVPVPAGSFVFTTPNGWTLDSAPPQAPISAVLFGPTASMKLIMEVYPQTVSLDDEINSFKPAVAKLTAGGLTTEETTSGKIGPEDARIYTFAGTRQDGSAVSGQIAVAFRNGMVYTFIALADAPALPNTADVTAVLTSVVFA